jgi:ribosomal protein L11 methyltransferase
LRKTRSARLRSEREHATRLRAALLDVDPAAASALSDALLAEGALAATIEDALEGTPHEVPLYNDPALAADLGWKRARIRALLAAEQDAGGLIRAAAIAAGLTTPPVFSLEPVPEQDWVGRIQGEFAPIRISDRLWIVPSWCSPPAPTALNITLDPGLAFGTGSHPTTKACLQWLERRVLPSAHVLDYGCGSGILAIAAMKLGAASAVGVDVDPAALEVARTNAAANGVFARFVGANESLDLRADLIVANILAAPLRMLAPLLAAQCSSNGCIALAGILERQTTEVISAYRPWFELRPFTAEEGWVALEATRR